MLLRHCVLGDDGSSATAGASPAENHSSQGLFGAGQQRLGTDLQFFRFVHKEIRNMILFGAPKRRVKDQAIPDDEQVEPGLRFEKSVGNNPLSHLCIRTNQQKGSRHAKALEIASRNVGS